MDTTHRPFSQIPTLPHSPVALQSMVLLCKALSTLTFPTLVIFSLGGFDARCATSGTSGMQTPQHQVSYFTTAFCGELVPNLKIVAVFGGYPKHEGPQSRSDPTRFVILTSYLTTLAIFRGKEVA